MAFSHHVDITTNSAVIDSDIANALAIVDLRQAPAAFWSNLARTDGGDIQIFDALGSTRYDLYAMFIDTVNQRGALAARVDSFTSAASKTFRIKLGDAAQAAPAIGETYGRNAVFRDWLMALNGMKVAGSAPQVEDMTGNGHDGTIDGSFALATGAGRFGQAIRNAAAAGGIDINDPSNEFNEDEMGVFMVTTKESVGNTGGPLVGWSGNSELRINSTRYQARIGGTNRWRLIDAIPEGDPQAYGFNFDLAGTFTGAWVNGVADDSRSDYNSGFPATTDFTWLGKANKAEAHIGTGSLCLWRTGSGAELSEAEHKVLSAMVHDNDTAFWTWGEVTSENPPFYASDERTFTPAAQSRTFTPPAQDRSFTPANQNREFEPTP